jgi:ketosteroid isomerase-like protein
MSEEQSIPDLVETTRRQFEAASRNDLDAFMDTFAAHAVYDASRDGVGVFEGRDAIRALIADWWQVFEGLRMEPEDVQDLGNGVTLTVVRHDARPAGSSREVHTRQVYVSVLEDGAISKVTVYSNVEEARVDAERLARSRGAWPES